jgi:hypothetical protein
MRPAAEVHLYDPAEDAPSDLEVVEFMNRGETEATG